MNASGETADQMVRMTLQGIEIAANVALKAGGSATKSMAVMLYAILTDQKKIKGKTHLNTMLKSGKELKVFAIRHEDLKTFCEEAKKYGVLYSVLKEKNNTDGICDIMVRAEDASKISRIVDKFELATIDTKAIKASILNEQKMKDIKPMDDQEFDALQKSIMDETIKKKLPKEKASKNFSKGKNTNRPSVRQQLFDIKKEKSKQQQIELPRVKKKKKGKSR